jgi:hypothetical protein
MDEVGSGSRRESTNVSGSVGYAQTDTDSERERGSGSDEGKEPDDRSGRERGNYTGGQRRDRLLNGIDEAEPVAHELTALDIAADGRYGADADHDELEHRSLLSLFMTERAPPGFRRSTLDPGPDI